MEYSMDKFPENLSFNYSNEFLSKIFMEKQKKEMESCRQKIVDSYTHSINNNMTFFSFFLKKSNFRKDVLLELLDKFPIIYIIHNFVPRDIRPSNTLLSKDNVGIYPNSTKYIVVLTDFYYDEIGSKCN